MEKYCEEIGIKTNHFAMLLSTQANIDMCLRDNKPVILFGNFRRPNSDETGNHAVVCYGLWNDVFDMSTKNSLFCCKLLVDRLFGCIFGRQYFCKSHWQHVQQELLKNEKRNYLICHDDAIAFLWRIRTLSFRHIVLPYAKPGKNNQSRFSGHDSFPYSGLFCEFPFGERSRIRRFQNIS